MTLVKKTKEGKFERTRHLDRPPKLLLAALNNLRSNHDMEGSKITSVLADLTTNHPRIAKQYLSSPGANEDRLVKDRL